MRHKYAQITEELRCSFEQNLLLLKGITHAKLNDRAYEARVLLASSCSTGGAMAELGKRPEYFFAETTMLARSFIEKLINFCYLNVCGEEEYKKFFSHAYYRAFHNLGKEKRAGDKTVMLRYTGKSSLKEHFKIADSLADFSDENPRHNWSALKIDEKVAFIGSHSSITIEFFLLNTLTIYSDASEALHGSLYGCTFHLGAYEPGSDRRDAKTITNGVFKKTALLYAQLNSMIFETVKLLAVNSNLEEELKKAKEISKNNGVLIEEIFP